MTQDDDIDVASVLAQARAWIEWETQLGSSWHVRSAPRETLAPSSRPSAASPPALTRAPSEAPRKPRLPLAQVEGRLASLANAAAACTACRLHTGRTMSVFARGNPAADLVFVGEGPGQHEDEQGVPFVGEAGQLLDRMVGAMGLGRDEVYVCNVVKCRPPDNRTPTPDEVSACEPYLFEQLGLVRPRVIVALGRSAAEGLGVMPQSGPWRGTWASWKGIAVMPTYHPAYLLRSPDQKRVVWDDLKRVMAHLATRGT